MKQVLLLFFIVLLGCHDYKREDISGRWYTVIDDQYIELWIGDELLLDWNSALAPEVRIRPYLLENSILHFKHPVHTGVDTIEFSMIIDKVADGKMTGRQYYSKRVSTYNWLDANVPKLSIDHDADSISRYYDELIGRTTEYFQKK